jgi:NAD(P)-dependent dehydrogenase (short-subunit alcohol dehydrogenase family)
MTSGPSEPRVAIVTGGSRGIGPRVVGRLAAEGSSVTHPAGPRMSRAVVHQAYGGPEVLEVREVPEPHAGPGEVRVRVRAVGLNPMDGSR